MATHSTITLLYGQPPGQPLVLHWDDPAGMSLTPIFSHTSLWKATLDYPLFLWRMATHSTITQSMDCHSDSHYYSSGMIQQGWFCRDVSYSHFQPHLIVDSHTGLSLAFVMDGHTQYHHPPLWTATRTATSTPQGWFCRDDSAGMSLTPTFSHLIVDSGWGTVSWYIGEQVKRIIGSWWIAFLNSWLLVNSYPLVPGEWHFWFIGYWWISLPIYSFLVNYMPKNIFLHHAFGNGTWYHQDINI